MSYPLEKPFQGIQDKGVAKLTTMIKIALKEMAPMNTRFQTGDDAAKKQVKDELLWIFSTIHSAMVEEANREQLPLREFEKKVYAQENYTSEEWSSLKEFSDLVIKYQSFLFPRKVPKEKKPKDKGTRRNFPKV